MRIITIYDDKDTVGKINHAFAIENKVWDWLNEKYGGGGNGLYIRHKLHEVNKSSLYDIAFAILEKRLEERICHNQ